MDAATSAPALKQDSRTGTCIVHAAFVLTGVMTTMLGPMLPMLSARWTLNDAQSGYLFTAQFAASTIGAILSAWLVPRYGYRLTLLLGVSLMAMAAGVLAHATWMFGIAAVFLNGSGFGITIPAANLLIAERNPGNRAAALNLLNFSWGMGAVGFPFLVAALQPSGHILFPLYGATTALVLLAIFLASTPFAARPMPAAPASPLQLPREIWKSRLVLVLGLLFFLYVGTEGSIGGWIASYAQRIKPISKISWAMTPSFFWGALLLGRLSAPLWLRHLRETSLATVGLVLAVLGASVLLAAKTMTFVVLGAGLAGLGLASVFPINISLLSHWFGEMASRIGGVLFAIAGLGGATLPWMVGAISTRFGSLRVGLMVPLLASTGMLALYLTNPTPRPRPRT